MNTGLAHHLRQATWPLHAQAERAGVMPLLLRGSLPLAGFARLQRNLLAIYQALEAGLLQPAAQAQLAPLPLAALQRSAVLADDLAALAGPGWAQALPLAEAASAYAARLQALAGGRPLLLAAHAYVRYLGDLAGGQALGRIARARYALAGTAGTRFFDFGPPAEAAALAQALRAGLDALRPAPADAQALLAEAQWAFAQHVRLFDELAAALATAAAAQPPPRTRA